MGKVIGAAASVTAGDTAAEPTGGSRGGRNEASGVSPGAAGDRTEPATVIPAQLADLLERPLYAHLATVRPDGTPQVNPTWVRFDGEYLWLTATTSRRKHRNWQVQPAVALSITDPDRPWRYLEIRGQVELIAPDPEGAEFVRLAERYGMPQGPPADAAERIAVAIRPLHTTTQ
jgi:PPOX class probable F420-dependent enzyme